jgi:outer membrane receptor protein involved in Fe transport
MRKLKYLLLLALLSTTPAIAQQIAIKGNVYDEHKSRVSDALISIKHKDAIHRLITDEKGAFKLNLPAATNDSLYLSVDKMGYAAIADSLVKINSSKEIRITLRESGFMLPDIVVAASGSRIEKSDKIIHKLSPSDYIKGTQASIALANIPGLSVAGNDIRLANRKSVAIFIDGIESSFEELATIKAEDIDKIELMPNPSAAFGSELAGGVLNIILRNRIEHSLKGELGVSKGIRLGRWRVSPMLAYRNKFITFSANYSYMKNNQSSSTQLDRYYNDLIATQTIDRETRGWQDYLSARMRIILTPKSNLFFTGNLSGYGFNSDNNVLFKLPESADATQSAYGSKEGWESSVINAIYKYAIDKNSALYLKGRSLNYENRNETAYLESPEVRSAISEYTGEAVYEKKNMLAGYKTIYREYDLDGDFSIYQYVNSAYLDLNATINNNLSLYASLFAEYTRNVNADVKQDYSHVLPMASLVYKLPYATNLRLNYSKKITRPSADYLNPNPIVLNPLHTLVGNTRLLPQDRHSYELSLNKSMKKGSSLSLNLSHSVYNKLISETLTSNGNMIVNSYDNLGNARRSSLTLGFYSKLFNTLSLNVSNGIAYSYFSSASDQIVVNENKGCSYNANLSLSTVIRKKLLLSLNGNYNTRSYSLASTSTSYPFIMLNARSNLFKDKVSVELTCTDIFSISSKTKNYIHSPDFNQTTIRSSNMFNITLNISYRFGKIFNESFRTPTIDNDDIITK